MFVTGLAGAAQNEKRLTEEEAKNVVLALLRSQRTKVARIEGSSDNAIPGHDFYAFAAFAPIPPNADLTGSGTLGGFLVNRTTADVFSAAACEEYHTPALTKLQTAIRKRFGLSAEDYRRLRRPSPLCEQD